VLKHVYLPEPAQADNVLPAELQSILQGWSASIDNKELTIWLNEEKERYTKKCDALVRLLISKLEAQRDIDALFLDSPTFRICSWER
jgi:hypothetical protein